MLSLDKRLDKAEEMIKKPSFRENKGLGNEVGYYIFDYPAEKELYVRERIEYIKQHNVRYHYRKEDCHNLAEREQIGLKHSMTGNVHHAVAHNRTAEYAYGSYCNNCTKLGSL